MGKPKPSVTAFIVGGATVWMSHHPALYKVVPDAAVGPTMECLRRSGGMRGRFAGLLRRKWFRKRVERYERRTLPGFMLHVAARKRYIEAAVRRAFQQEFTQVVVLGAGYDMLALRLHEELPKVTFIEVDHPATQRVKVRALGRKLPSANLAVVAADLSKPGLFQALASCPLFRPQANTVYIAEGLLMYLPPERVAGLLDELREGMAGVGMEGKAGSGRANPVQPSSKRGRTRLVFSFLEIVEETGRPGFPQTPEKFDRWLAKREPFLWGISRKQIGKFLMEHGFVAQEIAGMQTLRQRVMQDVPEGEVMAEGEFLGVADRG